MTATNFSVRFCAILFGAVLFVGCGEQPGSPEAELQDPTNPSNIASQQSGGSDSSSGGSDSSSP